MTIQPVLVAAFLGLALHIGAHAVRQTLRETYSCPQSLPQASIRLAAPDGGWTPFVASPLYLHGATPADGPPERLGILHETTSTRTTTGWRQTYVLDGRYPEGKWLRCDYGALGEASLAKRLPDATRACTVVTGQGEHVGENKAEVTCL